MKRNANVQIVYDRLLDCQDAVTGCHFPRTDSLVILHDHDLAVQRHGGADMAGDAVETIADRELGGSRSLEDKVFLAVTHGLCFSKIEKLDPWVRILGCDRFVPQIETQAIGTWFADHPRKQHGAMHKRQIEEFFTVTPIPEHRRAGTTLHFRPSGMDGKGRCSPRDHPGNGPAAVFEILRHGGDGRKTFVTQLRAPDRIRLVDVAIVGVQPARQQSG